MRETAALLPDEEEEPPDETGVDAEGDEDEGIADGDLEGITEEAGT